MSTQSSYNTNEWIYFLSRKGLQRIPIEESWKHSKENIINNKKETKEFQIIPIVSHAFIQFFLETNSYFCYIYRSWYWIIYVEWPWLFENSKPIKDNRCITKLHRWAQHSQGRWWTSLETFKQEDVWGNSELIKCNAH